jgi:hypothetical protein
MDTKLLEKYTIKPEKKTGPYFIDLAKKHVIKAKSSKKTYASQRVDQIVYGLK